jgi:hypothetical protein
MNLGLVLALVFLVGANINLWIQVPRVWRGNARAIRILEIGLSSFPFSAGVRGGIVRGIVPLGFQMFFLGVTAVSGILAMKESPERFSLTFWSVLLMISLVGMITAFCLHLAIILANRPAFLVPPGMRDENGVLHRSR